MFVGHQLVLTLRCTAGPPSGFYLAALLCFLGHLLILGRTGKKIVQNIGKILSLVLKRKCIFVFARKYVGKVQEKISLKTFPDRGPHLRNAYI